METKSIELRFSTHGDGDATDFTAEVQGFVDASGVLEGQVTAFVRGSTAAITTMEYEPGGVQDLKTMLDRLIPSQGDYEHNRLNHGTWQQVVLLDFDDRPRERTVVIQVFS
jgi:thiamine phosphate synthase YjbQ (UPF0047 family)